LVVDDEAYNCEVLKMMILSLGFPPQNLTLSMSGIDALSKIEESMKPGNERYSLIITDLSMPVMDGYKFIHKLRKAYSQSEQQQPVVATITGHSESEFFIKAFSKGANMVYSKPIKSELIQMLIIQSGLKVNLK